MAIWRVAIDESSGVPRGEPQPITTGGPGVLGLLSFSADGNRLAYTDSQFRATIRAAPFDAEQAEIGDGGVTLAEGARRLEDLSISHGGDWLTYRDEGPFQDIFVVATDGGAEIQITADIAKDWYSEVSPDGERVAYYSNVSGNYEIWVANRDGSNRVRLTDGVRDQYAYNPHWSPDGERMVYYRTEVGSFLIDPDTPYDQPR